MKKLFGILLILYVATIALDSTFVAVTASNVIGQSADEILPGEDVELSYDLTVHVVSVDYTRKSASVSIWARIECNCTNATEIGIRLDGDVYGILRCSSMGNDIFWGYETFDNWPLRGEGETYPFDSYFFRGSISRQFYFIENERTQILYPNATIESEYMSRDIELQTPDNKYINAQFIIRLRRDSFLQTVQLLVPVILSFFVLGASVLVDRSKVNERLSVYLALFFFAPTFLLAIQSFLPKRSMLAIPEILIIGILTATAFSAISTMVPVSKRGKKLDIFVIALSMILLFLLYYPILALQTSIPTVVILAIAETGVASGIIIRKAMSSKFLARRISRLLTSLKGRNVSQK